MNQKKITTLITTLPLTILLIVIIACSIVGNIHSKLLSVAEDSWSGYSELRVEPERPTCDAETAANQEAAPAANDSGADEDFINDLFGDEEIVVSDEAKEAAKAECDRKIAKYESIVERRNNSALKTFIPIEQGIGFIAANASRFTAQFLQLVFLFCALAATLNRQHLGLRSPTTKRGDRVSQIFQLIGNLAVLSSFIAYYNIVSHDIVIWIIAFGAMALGNVYLIAKPLKDPEYQPGQLIKDSWAKALLGVPLYAYMAIICTIYFLVSLHPTGVAIYLNKISENASSYTNVALYVFSGMILKNTTIADKFLSIIRPWKLSPELLVFCIVLLSAIPTAYSGASGIFVIAAGAIIYKEFKKSGVRDSLALAGTAMSGSMGIVLSPCLLVVIIAALCKDVTTPQLYSAGLSVFFVNIFVFACVLLFTHKDKLSCENPFKAFPAMLKNCVPVLPHIAIGAVVIIFFEFGLGATFNEYSVPYILPFMLICMLIYDRITERRAYNKALATANAAPVEAAGEKSVEAETSSESSKELASDAVESKAEVESKEASAESSKAADNQVAALSKEAAQTDSSKEAQLPAEPPQGIGRALLDSADGTANASGALLTLMGLSVCLGGILDRADMASLFPEKFSSKFVAMGVLVVILVIIGMIMDPYGAVILVSATMTQIAPQNGIDIVQFWLVVLCAFELGYLTPPVALNQLLTRQVVGEKGYEYEESLNRPKNFWYRHERILLPVTVKGIVLLLVAFMPLIINELRWMLK